MVNSPNSSKSNSVIENSFDVSEDDGEDNESLISQCEDRLQKMESELMDWYQKVLQYQEEFSEYPTNENIDSNKEDSADHEVHPHKDAHSTASSDDWVLEKILRRKRQEKIVYYLVKWKGHDEPSWETEDNLEFQGWSCRIEDFLSQKNCKPTPRARPIMKIIPSIESVPSEEEIESSWQEFERRWEW